MEKIDIRRVLICLARGYMSRRLLTYDKKGSKGGYRRMIGFRYSRKTGKVYPIYEKQDNSAKKLAYENKKCGTIWLKDEEYRRVVGALDTNFPTEQSGWDIKTKPVGDYIYIYRKVDGDYEFIGKKKLR